MTKTLTIPYLDKGLYTVAEASRLSNVPSQRLRRWILGYDYRNRGVVRHSPPVWQRDFENLDDLYLSFYDLMEARFVDAFTKHKVSLHAIRRAAQKARVMYGTSHPLSCKKFQTDGRTIFAEIADEAGESELYDLIKDQYAFKKVLSPYLYDGVDFENDTPVRWRPSIGEHIVVLDPSRSFGRPILQKSGTPTEIIYHNFVAGDSIEILARVYEETKSAVSAAIDFEIALAA